jgi:predicted TIM-barrel fold metal-dependent hydrolase
MIDVDIVDAHHHLCRLADGYPWLSGAPQARYHGDDTVLRHDYLVEDYLRDIGDLPLVGSVHVENGAGDPVREATWIDELCGTIPSVQVAKADLSAPAAPALLERHAALPSVRGIRDILNWHPDPYYTHRDRADLISDPGWRANFARLQPLGLSFDLQVFPGQLDEAAALAGAFPETAIVLDHLGMPIGRDAETLEHWRRGIDLIARRPNVSVKISAMGTTDHRWTPASVRPLILQTIEAFGPARCMFASNFPVDGMYSTLAELFAAFDAVTGDFSRAERASLFGGTARDFYRIDQLVLRGDQDQGGAR